MCQQCGAITIIDNAQGLRLLMTQEWIDVMAGPQFHDLFERRTRILDELTRPAS